MTEKLYYESAYIKEFTARVLSCGVCDGGYDVTLDRTAFFPEEGGQYSDTGMLDEASVISAYEKDGAVHHICTSPLEIGRIVAGSINFPERFEKMQCHTAEHILSGLFYKYHGLTNVGFHLGKTDVTMDISAPLSRDELDKIEAMANEIVYENVKVFALFPSKEELSKMTYRAKLDLTENVRIVMIENYDACACCAPHVSSTGEIGNIKILDAQKLRGGMRLHITAGRRALKVFNSYYKTALKVSDLISTPKELLDEGVENLLSNYTGLKSEYDAFRLESYKKTAFSLLQKGSVIELDGARTRELCEIANSIDDYKGEYLVLLSLSEGSYQYAIRSKTEDMRTKIKAINESLSGRGGGKGNTASGIFVSSIGQIRKYFE